MLKLSLLFFVPLMFATAHADTKGLELAPGSKVHLTIEPQLDGKKGWRSVYFNKGGEVAPIQHHEVKANFCRISFYAREKNPKVKGQVFVARAQKHPPLRGSYQVLILEGSSQAGKPVSMAMVCMDPDSAVNKSESPGRYDGNIEYDQLEQHIGENIAYDKLLLIDPKQPDLEPIQL